MGTGRRGSSLERDCFREDDIPDGDDDLELCEGSGLDEASEASSSESLVGTLRFA